MALRQLVARSRVVPLLALLLVGASAAAPTPEDSAREARKAFDNAQYEAAMRMINAALESQGSRDDETIWTLRVMRGEVLLALGQNDLVKERLKAELPTALRTSKPAVRRLLTLGYSALVLREPIEARRRLKAARAIAEVHQPQMMGEVYRGFAVTAPDVATCEVYARKAIAVATRHGDRRTEAQAMAALQYCYGAGKQFREAIQWGDKALALARQLGMKKLAGQTEGNLGWQYMELADYEAAEELFVRADATAVSIHTNTEHVTWLIQLGNLRSLRGDRTAARRDYLEAVEVGRSINHAQLGYALANLASLAVDDGRLDEASRFNAEALKLKRLAKDHEAELRSNIIDARIDVAVGSIEAATRTLNRVIAKATNPATQWEARGRLAEVFVKAKRDTLADEQFLLALKTVSEARQNLDRELRLSFFNTSSEIFAAYLNFLFDRNRLNGALTATEIIRTDALDDELGVRARPAFADPRAIAKQQNATILSYWLGPRRSYLWKITPTEVRAVILAPEKTIRDAVDAYRRDLLGATGSLQFTTTRGQRLYELLGIPKNLASGSRVIVIPDGNLHTLNFETLVVPGPKPHYWIEDVNIVAASSTQLLARRASPPNRSPRMLLIGDPAPADAAYPRLPQARAEMQNVERHFPPARRKVLTGAAATPTAYRNASPQSFDYVHFVAHGVATRRRPLESAVILSADSTNNYRLLARDILKQPLQARLVTISSCHGAGTRAYTGEGLVGLAWAFLRAGSSNVIAALWEVNDSAAPGLMNDAYREIAAGRDPATALREAKLKLVRSKSAYAKPFYWAPFVLYAGT